MTPSELAGSAPLRILLLEHDAADAELNLSELRRAGVAVRADVASTSAEFTAFLDAGAYDVVISDYRMPQWTGMDALATLRARGDDTPFILVTGTLGEERAVECLRQGVTDYVLKHNMGRLPMAVARAVRERRAQAEIARAEADTRQAEGKLREREARFRQMADNINEVFFLVDAGFTETLYINAAFERIWGMPREALYANPRAFVDAVLVEDKPELLASIGKVQAGADPGEVEFRIRRPEGQVRSVVSHAIPIADSEGRVIRIAGVVRDVTERRHARERLEVSEGRFRALADASFDAIAVTQDGVIKEVNNGLVEMFGYAESELVGQQVNMFLAPEVHSATERRILDRIEGRYDLIGVRKDGKRLILEATARERDDGGERVRVTALRNVTEQRALEQKYRQAQKMEAVGRLAGSVAHDFNNLLTVIGSNCSFLREAIADSDPQAEMVDEISHAADLAADLTRRLLAFSQQTLVQPRVVQLGEVVAKGHTMLRRLIGEDVSLSTTLAEAPLPVLIDPAQLEQVVMNLAVNARDAMPTGGRLEISTAIADSSDPIVIANAGPGAGKCAVLVVADNGTGMSEETRSRIFEPFFTTKEPGKGTGLGLATVYSIVHQASGFIDVESTPGNGTTVRIFLPIVPEGIAPSEAATPTSPPRGTETILLAEDSAPVRTSVRMMLERLGYSVIEATDGRHALGFVALRRPIDLLITDVIMPELSGRALVEQARAMRPGLRVVYMSGYTDDAVLRHGVHAAKEEFLQKPFTIGDLAVKVRRALDARVDG